jgi:hypothetical protein
MFEDLLSGILSDFAKEERLKTKQEFEENPDGNIYLGLGDNEAQVKLEGQSKFSGEQSDTKITSPEKLVARIKNVSFSGIMIFCS